MRSPLGIIAAVLVTSYLVYRVWVEYKHFKQREKKATRQS
jgi:hypothetical protein